MDNIFQIITLFNFIAVLVFAYRYHRYIHPTLQTVNLYNGFMLDAVKDVTTLYAFYAMDGSRLDAIEAHLKISTPLTPEVYFATQQDIRNNFDNTIA